jgi:hypothetical protein
MVREMRHGGRAQISEAGLHVCPCCRSQLVQPISWEQTKRRGSWHLWRRCPECEWRGDGVHEEAEIDAYDLELDDGTEDLAHELQIIARENMERMAESFFVALDSDLITAEDFA